MWFSPVPVCDREPSRLLKKVMNISDVVSVFLFVQIFSHSLYYVIGMIVIFIVIFLLLFYY